MYCLPHYYCLTIAYPLYEHRIIIATHAHRNDTLQKKAIPQRTAFNINQFN